MHKHLSLASLALLAGAVTAQNNMGLFANTDVTFTSRGGNAAANTNPSVQFTRIDVEKYAGWGVNATLPGTRNFTGLHFFIQDQDLATQDQFSVVAYSEDPALVGFPNAAAPIGTSGAFVLPVGTGAGAYNVTANFATPVSAPAAADVYVGISQNNVWNAAVTDGLSIWAISGAGGTTATRDLAGFSAPVGSPANTYSGFFVPTPTTLAYSAQRQFFIEPIVVGAGGVASALHYGDVLHVAAGNGAGTSCMFSSQYPDGASPSFNAGRADDLGMTFQMTGIPDNSLVFWLAEISGGFAPELPMSGFIPGSTGVTCVSFGASTMGFSFTTAGVATHVLNIGLATRPLLQGVPFVQQSVALDTTTFLLHAGPCQMSTF